MVKIYFESLKNHIKCELEYKVSFILNFTSNLLLLFSFYFVILALFGKFNNIQGFTVYEVLICFAVIQIGYSTNEIFFRGIDVFEDLIIEGELDRLLVRPQNVLFQVMCSKTNLVKLARILEAIVLLVISICNLDITFSIDKIITLLLMIIGSIALFFSIFLICASYCFYTIQGLEVKNLLTDGTRFAAQYPIGIYKKGLKVIFTYIIPIAVVNYYPLLYLTGKSTNIIYMFFPLISFLFIFVGILLFNIGLKHYGSTGS